MRTAGRMPPSTETCPTPGTELRRCAIMVSARSESWRSDMVGEVSASVTIGRIGRVHLGVGRRDRAGCAAAWSPRR